MTLTKRSKLVQIALAETSSGDFFSPLFGGEVKEQNQGNTWKSFYIYPIIIKSTKLSLFSIYVDMREYLPDGLVTSPSHEAQWPG